MIKEVEVICPKCGGEANQVMNEHGLRSSCCGLWSWGGKPLVDGSTHRARQVAHRAFDPIWQKGLMTRKEAYYTLSLILDIPRGECHIGMMDEKLAKSVLFAVEEMRRMCEVPIRWSMEDKRCQR